MSAVMWLELARQSKRREPDRVGRPSGMVLGVSWVSSAKVVQAVDWKWVPSVLTVSIWMA